MHKTSWVMGILIASFALTFSYQIQKPNIIAAQPATGVTQGKTLPIFTANSLDRQSVQVGIPGKPYVLNFWATWCQPCQIEFPELNQFANAHSEIQFYAIDMQESSDEIRSFLNSNGYTLPVLLDTDGKIADTFRINAIPTTIVVDSQGVILYRKTGCVTASELENVLSGLEVP
jgi:cytochrome c biogenesis protein CcmG/thiol:disulfide interchange protein DsbE